jgi:organic hydroperoxide reductase OsmC/OhrA
MVASDATEGNRSATASVLTLASGLLRAWSHRQQGGPMPAPFPHSYDVRFEARGPEGWLTAGVTRSPIEAGAPPEFDGSPDVWSPEHLLLSSLALCHFTTFHAFAGKARLDVLGFETAARAVLSKTPEGLAFTELVLDVTVDVRAAEREKAEHLLESAKRHCLVANALRTPVRLEARVRPVAEETTVPARG